MVTSSDAISSVLWMIEKVKTGVDGLDDLLKGGIPKYHTVLISGQAGSGKTIFGSAYIFNGASVFNEAGIYVSFEQKRVDVLNQAEVFGWDFEGLEKNGLVRVISYADKSSVNLFQVLDDIKKVAREIKAKRVVIDSISSLLLHLGLATTIELVSSMGKDLHQVSFPLSGEMITRMTVKETMLKLKNLDLTTMVISELPETSEYLSRDTISEYLADGVILLQYLGVVGADARTLQIRKMRNTDHANDYIPFSIVSEKGIVLNIENATKMLLK